MPNQRNTPYTRPPTSTQSTSKPTWLQRRQQQDTRAPMRAQQKVCIPDITLPFDPIRTVATCYSIWTLLTRDPVSFELFARVSDLDFNSIPHRTGPLFSNPVSQPPKQLLLLPKLSLRFT